MTIISQVIQSMRIICSCNPDLEWAAELWGYRGEHIRITDFILLKQEVSKYAVNQNLNNSKRLQHQIDTRYYHMTRGKLGNGKALVGWVHSHNTMEAFLSITDRNQIKEYFKNDSNLKNLLSIVVSTKRHMKGKNRIMNRVLRRVNKDIPFIELRMWIDGIYKYKSYFNYEINLGGHSFMKHNIINGYIPSSIITKLREEYVDLVKITKSKEKKNRNQVQKKSITETHNVNRWGFEYF